MQHTRGLGLHRVSGGPRGHSEAALGEGRIGCLADPVRRNPNVHGGVYGCAPPGRMDGRQSQRQFMMRVERPYVVIAWRIQLRNFVVINAVLGGEGVASAQQVCGGGGAGVSGALSSCLAWPGRCGVGHTQVVQALLKHGVDPQQIAPSHDLGCTCQVRDRLAVIGRFWRVVHGRARFDCNSPQAPAPA